MLKPSFTACKRLVLLLVSAGILTFIPFGPELIRESRAADNYSAAEKVYLKNITPGLYEFSQIAALVSESILTLQSSPAEECEGQFAYYGGLVSSLKKQLGTVSAPPRMESVHRDSLQSLADYETGLILYGEACVEEDYGMKEGLVSRGGDYINDSVGRIGRVYAEIDNLKTAQVPRSQDQAVVEDGADFEETLSAGTGTGVSEKDETAAYIKTREEVIDEISRRVETEKDTSTAAEPVSSGHERTVPETTASEYSRSKTATPEAAVPPVKPRETGAREVAPPAPEPVVDDADEKTGSKVESEDLAQKEDMESNRKENMAGEEKTNDETERIEKIEKMNQAIMQRGTESQEIPEGRVKEREAPASGVNRSAAPEIAAAGPETLERGQSGTPAPPDEIKSWCASKVYSEEEMANCIRRRTEAKENVERMVKASPDGTERRKILEKCKSDWKEGDTYNYDMVLSCVQFFCARKGIDSCEQMAR
ncbi:MAG: hypothetical protein RIG61_04865 [Deltaproteobacteria bacterium]